jgi:uncharacterized BrkB/YihY/UPF0761 family membrane protein
MKAVIDALNVMYEEDEKRGFFKLNAVSLAFTFGGIIAALVAISGVVALPVILGTFGASSVADNLLRIGRWPVLVLAMLFGLAVLYRYGPSRRSPQWRWLTVGSVFATLSWLAGSAAFSFYLANYANYGATYGSLGAAIGLMMWMWMSAIVILVSAELNAEVEHQTARDCVAADASLLGTYDHRWQSPSRYGLGARARASSATTRSRPPASPRSSRVASAFADAPCSAASTTRSNFAAISFAADLAPSIVRPCLRASSAAA